MQAIYSSADIEMNNIQESLDHFHYHHDGALDGLKAWAENLLKQKGELEAILMRCPGACSAPIMHSMEAE